ncbi:MAG TPA: hypothetical protein VGI43_00025 [Mucilaginibacter sp.]|jgi:hypothetical protein
MQKLEEYLLQSDEDEVQFLSEERLATLKKVAINPFVKISLPDTTIPFIVLPDGGVVADITANNPITVLKNMGIATSDDKLTGAGIIEVHHGSRILFSRRIESTTFKKKWYVDDIVSALQFELNLYYPDYRIGSH